MRVDVKKAIAAIEAAERLSQEMEDLLEIREQLRQAEAKAAGRRKNGHSR
jgi:hypothetical protein